MAEYNNFFIFNPTMRHSMQLFTYLTLTYLLFATAIQAQPNVGEKYYPQNELYQKLHVKQVIAINPDGSTYQISNIDKKGRVISEIYPGNRDTIKHRYIAINDTLFCYTFTNNKHTIKATDTTINVYNAAGKIAFYIPGSGVADGYEQFEYNTDNHLIRKWVYKSSQDKEHAYLNTTITKSIPGLKQAYDITTDEKGRVIFQKETIGEEKERSTDTFIYDAQNRLIKQVTFQQQGYLYCTMHAENIKATQTFSWRGDTCIETYSKTWDTTFIGTSPDFSYETDYWISYPNGLLRYISVDNQIMQRWQYRFYPDSKKTIRKNHTASSKSR